MKIAVVGKGGAGKTTVAGTVARALGREGLSVVAVDADVNPMLGISLGVGPERTEELVGARQALDAGELEHQPTAAGIVESFGADAPDGVRLVVVSRIDRYDPGWGWCGLSPEQLLGELEDETGVVICDMEAGLGTVSRVKPGQLDVVLVVAEPSAKGIDVARRAAQIASVRARVIVVGNRIANGPDLEAVQAALGTHEVVAVPEEPAIARADRDGIAPIDVDPDAPGVRALRRLAERLIAES